MFADLNGWLPTSPVKRTLTIALSIIIAMLLCVLLALVGTRVIPPLFQAMLATPTATASPTATHTVTPTTTLTPTDTPSATFTRTVTRTLTKAPTSTSTRAATSTPTKAATITATRTFTRTPTKTPTITPMPTATLAPTKTPAVAVVAHAGVPRLALASYFAWYDLASWDACNISAGDRPLQPYNSDDPTAIARHIKMARDAGLDGFTLSWFAPGERTDNNFATLLARSAGTPFASTIIFQRHIWHGSPAPTSQNIAAAVHYVMERYAGHPNFLKLEGKPVLFFTDLPRTPAGAGSPQQFWAAIRQEVDPKRAAVWIGEGLDFSYLATFDGQYVFKISHAAYPNDYIKSSRWAGQVRSWEQQTGQRKLWIATLSPGWDDLRSGCRPDVRVASEPHKVERGDGAFLRANYEAAVASNPDWLWLHSFNEWVEGTYIEPGVQYGDRYLALSREMIQTFKAHR